MNDATTEEVEDVEVTEVDTEVTETDETTEDVEASQEGEPSESSTEKKEGEGKDKIQERIDEITKFRREEERQRIAAERRAEELERQLQQLKPKVEPGKTLEDFDYDTAKFTEYLSEVSREQAREEARAEAQREAQQRQEAEFRIRERDYAKEHPEYYTATRNPDIMISEHMVAVARGTEHGPAILHHLSENPDVSSRLANMSPLDAAREMGRIEATLTQPKPKPVSKAPDPPKTLKATEKVTTIPASSPDSDKLSTDEWLKRRQKELAKKRA